MDERLDEVPAVDDGVGETVGRRGDGDGGGAERGSERGGGPVQGWQVRVGISQDRWATCCDDASKGGAGEGAFVRLDEGGGHVGVVFD